MKFLIHLNSKVNRHANIWYLPRNTNNRTYKLTFVRMKDSTPLDHPDENAYFYAR